MAPLLLSHDEPVTDAGAVARPATTCNWSLCDVGANAGWTSSANGSVDRSLAAPVHVAATVLRFAPEPDMSHPDRFVARHGAMATINGGAVVINLIDGI